MAAFVMTRYRRFRGKTAFSSMISAPLVMPDVITGLSLLLLFVAMANDWLACKAGHADHLDCPCHLLRGLYDGDHLIPPAGSGSFHRGSHHGPGSIHYLVVYAPAGSAATADDAIG